MSTNRATQITFSLSGTATAGVGLLAILLSLNLSAQPGQSLVSIDEAYAADFAAIASDERVQQELANIEAREPATVREQFRMTEIPAPPFLEQERAEYFLAQLQARGLEDAYIDSEGNAVGIRRGTADLPAQTNSRPTILIAAHLDTVFPEGTDTSIELRGGRYYAPGIGDDTRGLAALLSVIQAFEDSGIETVADIIFAGNVG